MSRAWERNLKTTGIVFSLAMALAAAGPAIAQDTHGNAEAAPTDLAVTASVAAPAISWTPPWVSPAEPADGSSEKATAEGGPPTPIVPAAYTDATGRPANFR